MPDKTEDAKKAFEEDSDEKDYETKKRLGLLAYAFPGLQEKMTKESEETCVFLSGKHYGQPTKPGQNEKPKEEEEEEDPEEYEYADCEEEDC